MRCRANQCTTLLEYEQEEKKEKEVSFKAIFDLIGLMV